MLELILDGCLEFFIGELSLLVNLLEKVFGCFVVVVRDAEADGLLTDEDEPAKDLEDRDPEGD